MVERIIVVSADGTPFHAALARNGEHAIAVLIENGESDDTYELYSQGKGVGKRGWLEPGMGLAWQSAESSAEILADELAGGTVYVGNRPLHNAIKALGD